MKWKSYQNKGREIVIIIYYGLYKQIVKEKCIHVIT